MNPPILLRSIITSAQFRRELFFVFICFLITNALLTIIYIFLPNIYDVAAIVNTNTRFVPLRRFVHALQFVFALFSVINNSMAVVYCFRSRLFTRTVIRLMLSDSIAKGTFSVILLWAFLSQLTQCSPFPKCSDNVVLTTVFFWVHLFLGSGYYISGFLQIAFSLNRFLALSFNGLYSQHSQKYSALQIGFPVLAGVIAERLQIFYDSVLMDMRFIFVSATLPLDLILIYKLAKNKVKKIDLATERFLLVQYREFFAVRARFSYCEEPRRSNGGKGIARIGSSNWRHDFERNKQSIAFGFPVGLL
ncbi:unnamed protein product, partial [Mesorhabditis belari]|uniref:Uncharacterized protein n=1 Tax=Mesorhabditis belari TaxID=2138241 RepID=A0AAF3ESZ9_9BILA